MSTRTEGRVGPVAMLVPVLVLGGVALWLTRDEPVGEPFSPEVEEVAVVAGWGAAPSAELPGLRARLTRLHSDAERQEFDARVLRGRLGLDPGEPYLLELWRDPAPDDEDALALQVLGVAGENGRALSPLSAPDPAGEGEVADPLRVLFSPPTGALRPGQAFEVLLWGGLPSGPSRLELVLDGEARSLELAPTEFLLDDLPRFLARRDPGDPPTGEEPGSAAVR